MPEEPEVETHELQETLDELHEERREREEEQKRNAWTRYIALTTAFLAVFAAIGAMQSGALVNEAMISQIKAADTWNEYQADSLKGHTYGIAANGLLDAGAPAPPPHAANADGGRRAGAERPAEGAMTPGLPQHGHHAAGEAKPTRSKPKQELRALAPAQRVSYYRDQIEYENGKKADEAKKATDLEHEAEELMKRHHQFALSVAFIQVAIALSAVAALTRMKSVWAASLAIGAVGIVYFVLGFVLK